MIYYLSILKETPCKDYWDYGFIYDLFGNAPYKEVSSLPTEDFAIVVIPARHHAKVVKEINKELQKLKGVVLFLMGDEEADFPVEQIEHKNIKIWVQNPKQTRHGRYTKLGTGYPPQIRKWADDVAPTKDLDYFFSGQITHSRREEMAKHLRDVPNGKLVETAGFTQGLDHAHYYHYMRQAKIVPCPSGPQTPDSFRLFEALEMGCIPIADTKTPKEDCKGFWDWLFDEPVPFTQIEDWESLPGYIDDLKVQYPKTNNRILAFWMRYKAKMRQQLRNDIEITGGINIKNNTTVVIPVSPIPSHPDTKILDETINSAQYHFPNSEIIITFDGVRAEQEGRRNDYEEHIRRVLWKYKNAKVVPFIFEEHLHQVGMARAIIDYIKTPLIFYMEHDTPLVLDYEIEWDQLAQEILSGNSNLIRFHFEAHIPEEHTHLMIGKPERNLLKTVQWSQRPHLASTAFYKRLLSEQFSNKAKCFIEDLVHGKVMNDFNAFGEQGWNQWRLHIYHPEGDNIKRSYHTDGRAGSAKFDDTQVW
jgi:hypothetical protein